MRNQSIIDEFIKHRDSLFEFHNGYNIQVYPCISEKVENRIRKFYNLDKEESVLLVCDYDENDFSFVITDLTIRFFEGSTFFSYVWHRNAICTFTYPEILITNKNDGGTFSINICKLSLRDNLYKFHQVLVETINSVILVSPYDSYETAKHISNNFTTAYKNGAERSLKMGDSNKSSKAAEVESKYTEYLSALKQTYSSISGIKTKEDELRLLKEKIENALCKMISEAAYESKVAIKTMTWDNLSIAFFGETGAGKSTIIETFRILLKEKGRSESLKNNPEGVDGEIVGDGTNDFTKDYTEYKLKYKDTEFSLIDIPGIEGEEKKYVDTIKEALTKAHIVCYIQGHNKKPDDKTANKISEYLKDWIQVYSVYNVKGNTENYDEEEEREKLRTEDVQYIEEQIKECFKKILGEKYQGNITLQGLLALSSLAKFSPNKPRLIRNQSKFEQYFGNKNTMFEFSNFMQLLSLIQQKSNDYMPEIIESNKLKIRNLVKTSYYKIQKVYDDHEKTIKDINKRYEEYEKVILESYAELKSKLNSECGGVVEEQFDWLEKEVYSIIENDSSNSKKKTEIKAACNLLASNLKCKITEIIRNRQAVFNKTIKEKRDALQLYKTSSGFQSENAKDSYNINEDDIIGPLEIDFGDILGWIGALAGFWFGPIIGVIGLVGNIFKYLLGDHGRGEARAKAREEINKAKVSAKTSLRQSLFMIVDKYQEKYEKEQNLILSEKRNINEVVLALKKSGIELRKLAQTIKFKEYGEI